MRENDVNKNANIGFGQLIFFDELGEPVIDLKQHQAQQQERLDQINYEYRDLNINFIPCYPPEKQADDDNTNNQSS
jgi:hypothetical protein